VWGDDAIVLGRLDGLSAGIEWTSAARFGSLRCSSSTGRGADDGNATPMARTVLRNKSLALGAAAQFLPKSRRCIGREAERMGRP
jgi:hypothetical protein